MLALTLLALGQAPEAPATPAVPSATAVLTGEATEWAVFPDPGAGKFDLTVGLPTALRYQHPLTDRVWGEVGGSLWVILPDLFGGLRADLPLHRGRRDCFAVRPGADARLFWNYVGSVFSGRGAGVYLAVSADVDFVWRRVWADGPESEFGLKLGAAHFFTGGDNVIPVVGLLFGVRF